MKAFKGCETKIIAVIEIYRLKGKIISKKMFKRADAFGRFLNGLVFDN